MPIYRAFKCHLDVARLFLVGGKNGLDLRAVAAATFLHESICSEEARGPVFFLFETHSFFGLKKAKKHVVLDGNVPWKTHQLHEDWNGEKLAILWGGRTFLLSLQRLLGFVGLKGCCRLMTYVFKLGTLPERKIAHWKSPIFPGKYHQNGRFFHGYVGLQDLQSPKSSFHSLSGVKGCPAATETTTTTPRCPMWPSACRWVCRVTMDTKLPGLKSWSRKSPFCSLFQRIYWVVVSNIFYSPYSRRIPILNTYIFLFKGVETTN